MTIQVRAQLNGGAQQTGAVTVADGDVVQLSLASAAGLGPLLWEIYSHPTDEAGAGYALPLPSGWTDGPDGHSYFYEGTTPPTFTIPSAPYWGKILVRCTPGGDALAADTSLVLTMLSPLGLEDVAPLETIQADAYRTWMRAFQNDLRLLGAGSAGTPYASTPAAVASSGKSGASGDYARGDHVHAGVASVAATGKAGITGAATLSAGKGVTLTQVSNDIEIASTGGGGVPGAIAFAPDVVTDEDAHSYQTWAEVRTVALSTSAPLRVRVKGVATTSGTTGPDDFRHVTFVADDPASSLTFTEGVELRGPSFDGEMSVTSTATTTVALQYDENAAGVFRNVRLSGDTRGLITATTDASLRFENVAIGNHTFESTTASTVNVYTPGSEWVDAEQFFGSSGATYEFKRNQDTTGEPDLSALTATYTKVSTPYVGAVRPTLPAACLVRFRLDDAAGTTTINNSGNGTAFSLGTRTGAGSETFGCPGPFGDSLLVVGVRYFNDASGGITYQPSATNFSASCWVTFKKNPALGGANFVSLFGKLNATDSTFALGFDLNLGEFKCKVGAGGTDTTSTGQPLMVGERHLLTMTYDGSNIRLYQSGVLVQTTAKTGALDWSNTHSWVVGNAGAGGAIFLLDEVRFLNTVQTLAEIKAEYNEGAFNGAIGSLSAVPSRGVVASLEWTATAGVYTIVSSQNVAGVTGYDYGSGTNSLKVTLASGVTNGIAHATADPDWVNTFHIDPAGPVMVSSSEVRVDYRNKADTQISPADGAGTLTVFGDL